MIREMTEYDIQACYDIVLENWDQRVADKFIDEVNHAFDGYVMEWPPKYYVVEVDGRVVAFAGMMWSWIMSGVMDFIWINVAKEHQGRGYGHDLTHHRIGECVKREVRVINLMTQKPDFFRSYGFVMTYAYDGGWISMTRQLAPLDVYDV